MAGNAPDLPPFSVGGRKVLFCGCSGGESAGKGREIFVKKI